MIARRKSLPKLLLVSAVFLLLISAGLIGREICRPTQDSSPARPGADAGTATPAPATSAPTPDGTSDPNAIRITLRPTDGSAGTTAVSPGPRPPYPWAVPKDAVATYEKLETLTIDLDFTDATLFDILDFIAEFAKLKIIRPDPKDPDAGKAITFQLRELKLSSVLHLLLAQYGMKYAVTEDGALMIGKPDQVHEIESLRMAHGLEDARGRDAGEERLVSDREAEGSKPDEQTMVQLRAKKVNLTFSDAPLADVLSFLREFTGQNIAVDPSWTSKENADEARINLRVEDMPVDGVLNEIARQAGGEFQFGSQALLLVSRAKIEQQKAEREALRSRVLETLGRRVKFSAGEIEAYRLAGLLQAQAGVEVVVDEAIWNRPKPVTLPQGDQRLQDALDTIAAQNGLSWRLVGGVLYLF